MSDEPREPGPYPRAPDRRYTVLGLSEVLARGMVHLVRSGGIVGRPAVVALRAIDWYQREVSAGQDACPSGRSGAHLSCSAYGRRAVERDGWRGIAAAARRIHWCRSRQIAGAV